MSKLDWEFLQSKVIQALSLAASSIVVACHGIALASPIKVDSLDSQLLQSTSTRLLNTPSTVKLAETMPLSSVATMAKIPKERETYQVVDQVAQQSLVRFTQTKQAQFLVRPAAVHLSRIDRQKTPAVDLTIEDPLPKKRVDINCAEGLRIPPRFGASYSTNSAGFDDIIGAHGFLPLDQDECEDITFLEGNVQLNDGDFGFGLNVGHRNYDPEDNEIDGGYIGIDSRDTDNSTFYQVAAGYEHLEEDWELRLNGYLPLGDQTRTLQNTDVDTGIQTTSGFQGNQLMLSSVRDRQRILQKENALGGFDIEVGTQLDEWYGGELMGYIGAYLLTGEESSLGGQARLMTNFESNFNAGLSYQYDDIFGSSLGFSISASLPGTRFHRDGERAFQEENEVVIRLRDPIVRRPNVAVNVISEAEMIVESDAAPLRNPEEEEDYRFVHVSLSGDAAEGDAIAGDGTYGSPLGSVEDAIALINSDPDTYLDGNTVIYVDGESAPNATIPGFTIPDRVRVISQGPEQVIAGMDFPGFPELDTRLPFSPEQNFNTTDDDPNANGVVVLLPDSGDGVFPTITGGATADLVTLGNNTLLAGFNITDAENHGVTANDISNVELRNNRIENSGGSGIALNNVGGSVVLFDNEINNSADRGIHIQNSLTERSVEVAIAGFDLSNNRVGMEFVATASATEFPSQRVVIVPSSSANTSVGTPGGTALTNSIRNSTDQGIIVEATGSTTTLLSSDTQEVSISEITVDGSGATSGAAGIRVLSRDGAHSQEFNLANSTVSNSGGNGIEAINGENPNGATRTASAQEIVIRDSAITENGGNGIDVSLADASVQELVIRGNQILNNTGDGIRSRAQNVGVQEWRTDAETGDAGISENTIRGNGSQAIVIEAQDVANLPIVSIVNNDLSGNTAGPDIEVTTTALGSSKAACLIVADNIAPLGIQLTGPDPILTGGIPTVSVRNLSALLADSNITFLSADLAGVTSPSNASFVDETNVCIP